jgi:hypothetical protein
VLEIFFKSTLFDRPSFGSKVCSSDSLSLRKVCTYLASDNDLQSVDTNRSQSCTHYFICVSGG